MSQWVTTAANGDWEVVQCIKTIEKPNINAGRHIYSAFRGNR